MPPSEKHTLHPRNQHRVPYDFADLVACHPALGKHIVQTPRGETSIDFADATAVRELNAALLSRFYHVDRWEIPDGYLCPPVPSRADYIHNVADLLAADNVGHIPRGRSVRMLDIGVGANAIYSILARTIYGWSCVGSEIDASALENARRIFQLNPSLEGGFEGRLQLRPEAVLDDLVFADERFDLCVCNPPFHSSAAEARAGTQRKWRNLGRPQTGEDLNFSGRHHELWCQGGEQAFIRAMIRQSRPLAEHCLWFSSLVSRRENLRIIEAELDRQQAETVRIIEMLQGQKTSRIVTWTFLPAARRQAWARHTWSA